MRIDRRNRTAEDLGIMYKGGLNDLFDNEVKSAYRINDAEFNYLCEYMSDDEMDLFVGRPAGLTFAEKRKLVVLLETRLNDFRNGIKGISVKEREKGRSENYYQLSLQEQWDQDKSLGILDWDGN